MEHFLSSVGMEGEGRWDVSYVTKLDRCKVGLWPACEQKNDRMKEAIPLNGSRQEELDIIL